jgi:hypothetical protein
MKENAMSKKKKNHTSEEKGTALKKQFLNKVAVSALENLPAP